MSCWIDCLQRQISMRKKELTEILVWCENCLDKLTDDEDEYEVIHIIEMIDIFKHINTVLQQYDGSDVEIL